MNLPGVGAARRAGRWLQYTFVPGALILMYHRVAELPTDPYSMCVRPQHFAEHLDVLHRTAKPISLEALVRGLRYGALPRRAVVITFDDGYADNLEVARPLLERYEIPATVFVASGYIGGQREFWWDELDRLLLQPGALPEYLRLNIGGRVFQWQLGEAAHYSVEDQQRRRSWNMQQPGEAGSRQALFCALWQHLYAAHETDRSCALEDLRVWANIPPTVRPTHRAMTADELGRLAEDALIEIGAHTVTHSALANLPAAAQYDEIRQSRDDLEALFGQRVASFSYPHGAYTDNTITAVCTAGFGCACSTLGHRVTSRSKLLELPRMFVDDWDGETFSIWLERWFRA